LTQPGSALDNEISFSTSTSTDALHQNPDEIVMDILKYVFFSVNWPDCVSDDAKLRELVARGYAFNVWR
jgi:hypothetical protein